MNIPGNKRVLLADLSTIDADVGTQLWVEGVGKYEAVPRDQKASNAVDGPTDALTPISWQPDGALVTLGDGSTVAASVTHTPIADIDDLATLRTMMAAGVYPEQVRLKCHTAPGVGGGIYTRSAVGSYVDDNGATIVDANWAYLLPEKDVSLHSFGADITGTSLCDTAIANYLACVAARGFGVFYFGPGQFRCAATIRFNAASMRAIRVVGTGAGQSIYGAGGTRIVWKGAAPNDVMASEQPNQVFEDFEINVSSPASARCCLRWQTSEVPIVGAMTNLKVRRCTFSDGAFSGSYADAIACCPDVEHQAEHNHENLLIEDCYATGYSHAGLANYNLSFQAYFWRTRRFNTHAAVPTDSYAVYMATGNCLSEGCSSTGAFASQYIPVGAPVRVVGSGSERTKYAYVSPFNTAPGCIEIAHQRIAKAFPASGASEALAADAGSGTRLWTGLHLTYTEGNPILGQMLSGNGRWPQDITVINSILASTSPALYYDAYMSQSARTRIKFIGCMGVGPRNYLDLAEGNEPQARHIRSAQDHEDPWIFRPTDPQCRAHYTVGPSVVPREDNQGLAAQWRSDSPLAQPMTRAPGANTWPFIVKGTRTGGNQLNMTGACRMSTPGAGRMNPGAQSFLIVAVVRLGSITTEQCILGKCDFDGVIANNWQCLVTASGTLQLAWGNATANRYPASVQALSTVQKDYVLAWGLDRATNEVIYSVLRENTEVPVVVERQAITITDEVFANDADVYASCNTAEKLQSSAYFTHWSMYIMDRNADPYDGTTSMLSNKSILGPLYQMVREFSLAP